MNILSIGNSYSTDAQRYLHQIARADGVKLNCATLYIGGCPLATHYRNMLSQKPEYILQYNGEHTGFKVNMEEALLNRDWDVVTVQQVSTQSVKYENYQPYLDELVEYIRACVPKAKIVVHQTWAYEQGSEKLNNVMGYADHADMFRDLQAAYVQAAEAIEADYTIPSGELFQAMLAAGIPTVHRDTFHASYGLGRYALGLLWYTMLTGRDVSGNAFTDLDEPATAEEMAIAKACVAQVAAKYGR